MWSTGLYFLKWCLLQLTESQCFIFAVVSRFSTCPNCSQTFRNLDSIFSIFCTGLESKSHPEVLQSAWWLPLFLFDLFSLKLLCTRIPDPLMAVVQSWVLSPTELQLEKTFFTCSFYDFLSHLVFNGSQDYILFINVIFLRHDYRNPLCCPLIQNQIL